MNDGLIRDIKHLIDSDNLSALQSFYIDLTESYEEDLDFPYIFRHVYVHACLKKRHAIVTWLKELYETMDPIMKIALRQIFPYGDHLLRK